MAYIDYMDLAVPRKAVEFNHSLTHGDAAVLLPGFAISLYQLIAKPGNKIHKTFPWLKQYAIYIGL